MNLLNSALQVVINTLTYMQLRKLLVMKCVVRFQVFFF
jgi:hypothetical protein